MAIFKEDSFFNLKEKEGLHFPLYLAIRDNPDLKNDRNKIEEIYADYRPFFGDNENQLAHQLAQHPNSLIWHFCLMKVFERNGFTFEKAKTKGADILCYSAETKICVEAVAAQMGKVQKRYYKNGVSVEFFGNLDWRVVSRITQQLENKIKKPQALDDRTSILAISTHGVDRAYLKKFMEQVLFSNKSISLPSGGSIILNYGDKLHSAGFSFVIYSDHDPLIYLDDLEIFLEIYDLKNKCQIKGMSEFSSCLEKDWRSQK